MRHSTLFGLLGIAIAALAISACSLAMAPKPKPTPTYVNIRLTESQLTTKQRQLADKLQVCGLDIDKNAIQRIECGKRFVTDIELVQLAKVLCVEISRLVQ